MLSDILHIHNPNNPSLPQGLVSDSPPVIYQGHVVHATRATSPVGLFPRGYPRLLLKKKKNKPFPQLIPNSTSKVLNN